MKRVLIIAKTQFEASYWAKQWGLDHKDWRFVSGPEQLEGYSDVDIRFVGDWFKRPDAKELRAGAAWIEKTRPK